MGENLWADEEEFNNINGFAPTIFFNALLEVIWDPQVLANKCQVLSRVSTRLEGRPCRTVLEPNLKRLAISKKSLSSLLPVSKICINDFFLNSVDDIYLRQYKLH